MAQVSVRNLSLSYGTAKALDDVSLDFPDGQLFGLLGPSGSGKTTLLRAIAGFVQPDTGRVMIGGESVERVPVEKREIGMMFQSYALFPNMSVADNIGFGLRVRRLDSPEITRRVGEALDLVQLGGLGNRRPHQLSGGQRQRVALARAIVTRPRVLLLDEPLSALDKALRSEMQVELRRIQREVGITTIFVTHDQEEALTLSDQIGILRAGRLVQSGPPRALYHAPQDRFTAAFLGEANFFSGAPENGGLRLSDGTLLPWPGGRGGGMSVLAVRPEEINIASAGASPTGNVCVIRGELGATVFSGPTAVCHVQCAGQSVRVLVKNSELSDIPATGPVTVSWPVSRSMLIRE
jgi:putative spermidine/putrescine transport system ATP-binding protein